jgi:hypothetical protein
MEACVVPEMCTEDITWVPDGEGEDGDENHGAFEDHKVGLVVGELAIKAA